MTAGVKLGKLKDLTKAAILTLLDLLMAMASSHDIVETCVRSLF